MSTVFIGLGSNLEDPICQLHQAFEELRQLPKTTLLKVSSLYASKAVGPVQPDYVNAVAELKTELEPLALLDALQAIELAHHRVRKEHWGPRTLDLDILLIDQLAIDTPRLTVPHPYLEQRNFVLLPLEELAPDLRLPSGEPIHEVVKRLGQNDIRILDL